MKKQVFMSPNNGALVIGTPLFQIVEDETLANIDDYVVAFSGSKPLAYALEIEDEGKFACTLANAEWVNKKLISLGDL